MALPGGVLGKKNVARIKSFVAAVAQTDGDAASERYHPPTPRRTVKVDDMGREIVAK
jgi:hypothetical protein